VTDKNKQEDREQMTTSNSVNNGTIINLLMFGKSSKLIRDQYKLNTHHVTVLIGCYLYASCIKGSFTISNIRSFVGYYSLYRLKGYLDKLVSIDMLTFSGRYYSLTNQGYKTIEDISNNYDKVIYQFCSKFNIEL
jgi:hypothetical protein